MLLNKNASMIHSALYKRKHHAAAVSQSAHTTLDSVQGSEGTWLLLVCYIKPLFSRLGRARSCLLTWPSRFLDASSFTSVRKTHGSLCCTDPRRLMAPARTPLSTYSPPSTRRSAILGVLNHINASPQRAEVYLRCGLWESRTLCCPLVLRSRDCANTPRRVNTLNTGEIQQSDSVIQGDQNDSPGGE